MIAGPPSCSPSRSPARSAGAPGPTIATTTTTAGTATAATTSARRALEEGRARPLAEILEAVQGRLDGEVIGVEFDREDGRYVYEFKVVGADGRLREVEVDALSAEILKVEDD